jgi:hypothetical protein
MNKIYVIFFIAFSVCFSCKTEKKTDVQMAQKVVDKAIKVAGGEYFKTSEIEFDFRDRHYKATRNQWKFTFERILKDTVGETKDVYSNAGFQRFMNDSLVVVPDSMAVKYISSINAVHYFAVLPYGLNDKAVNKTYLGEVSVKGKAYHKIKVTFAEEGGGEDFEDIFVYWINKDTYEVDYLAYSYEEDNYDVGLRFREAYNRSVVNGLAFTNYNNYKPIESNNSEFQLNHLLELDRLFEKDSLQLLSKIELKNIQVNVLPKAGQ